MYSSQSGPELDKEGASSPTLGVLAFYVSSVSPALVSQYMIGHLVKALEKTEKLVRLYAITV